MSSLNLETWSDSVDQPPIGGRGPAQRAIGRWQSSRRSKEPNLGRRPKSVCWEREGRKPSTLCDPSAQSSFRRTAHVQRKADRGALERGGFARGITAEEVSKINRQLGGVTTLTGDVSTTLANAARRQGFWRKSATIVRDIAGGHKFDDANKRTAQAVLQELVNRNGVRSGVGPDRIRRVIMRVARGELREVEDIAIELKGY